MEKNVSVQTSEREFGLNKRKGVWVLFIGANDRLAGYYELGSEDKWMDDLNRISSLLVLPAFSGCSSIHIVFLFYSHFSNFKKKKKYIYIYIYIYIFD